MKILLRTATCLILLAICASAAQAVPRLMPPSEFVASDGLYRAAVAKIAELTEDGRYRLEVLEELRGVTPDGTVVRVLGNESGVLEVGKTYIVVHTDKPGRRSHRWKTDPAGSRVLSIPAVGPGAFEVSEAIRVLVRFNADGTLLRGKPRLDAVMAGLGSKDPKTLRFVTAELAIDEELRLQVGESELERLQEVLAAGTLETLSHEYVLRAALKMVEAWGGDWLAADSRQIVSSHGTELELTSLIPSLLVTALRTLGATGVKEDAKLAEPHIASNNPGVGKAAFGALVALDRVLAGEVAAGLGAGENLHPDTLRFVYETASREALDSDAR